MDDVHIPANHLWLAGMFSFVLAKFTSIVVKIPRFSDFGCHEFDDDVHRLDILKVVGKVSTYAE